VKVMVIFGTRPEGIKLAPLIQELQKTDGFECVMVNTGQHYEMLNQVLSLFSLRPEYDLKLMKPNQNLDELTANMIIQLGNVLKIEKPALVIVLGDTTTTFVGAYSAFLRQIPIAHVEAGLRTNQIYSPFPEEMYRKLTTNLSTYHFAPTEKNKKNLIAENIPATRITVVGNPVIDSLINITGQSFTFPAHLQSILDYGRRIILVTTHRRENLSQLKGVYIALNCLIREFDDIEVIFPVHLNPNVRMQVSEHLQLHDRIHLTGPLDYECFAHLMKRSYLLITDSGGIQEEAPALGIPVLVARESTERPEGVEAGTLRIVGTIASEIFSAARLLLQNQDEHSRMAKSPNPYGDGLSSKRILEFLKNEFLI
jgi:UDP-N-acetylglucosamine 2-epimerase (non-hydrolysing)